MSILAAIAAFAGAWLIGLALTPWVARMARRLGAVDEPDGHRKSQQSAVATGGGLAVALSAAAGFVFAKHLLLDTAGSQSASFDSASILVGLLPASLVLIGVGLVDDLFGLTGVYKLVGQVLSVSLLVAGGFHFDYVSLFWVGFPLGHWGVPFTMFFCLGAINAFNLIDGLDSLASSVGTVVCLTLGLITAAHGDMIASLVCFAFAGSLVGFLRYNVPPAKIYLGDTGSMLIGLVVAAVAIHCSVKEQTAFMLLVPIAVCAIPILDAAAAMVRRVTTGQSVFTPDRGHLHHALLLRGWSAGKTAAFITLLTAITCSAALASFFTNQESYALVTTGGVFIILAITKVFGHAELKLLITHGRSLSRSLAHRAGRMDGEQEQSIQLQGNRQWQTIWQALCDAATVYNLAELKLTISIPHLHESFYASWRCREKAVSPTVGTNAWQIVLPLTQNDRQIGKLSLLGGSSSTANLVEMQQLLDYLDPLEAQLALLINQEGSTPVPATHRGQPLGESQEIGARGFESQGIEAQEIEDQELVSASGQADF